MRSIFELRAIASNKDDDRRKAAMEQWIQDWIIQFQYARTDSYEDLDRMQDKQKLFIEKHSRAKIGQAVAEMPMMLHVEDDEKGRTSRYTVLVIRPEKDKKPNADTAEGTKEVPGAPSGGPGQG